MRCCWRPRASLRVYTRAYTHTGNGPIPFLRGRSKKYVEKARAASTSHSVFPLLPSHAEKLQDIRPLICRASLSSLPFSGKSLSVDVNPLSNHARFISRISVANRDAPQDNCTSALDPDYYRVKKEEGIPVGVRLKIWNLPEEFDTNEFKEWFGPPDVVNPVLVDKVVLTDEPVWLEQNIRAFVDFVTLDYACMAIVKYDGCKFKGRCIRMDFVEKRPHEKDYGGPRSRPSFRSNRNYGVNTGPNYGAPPQSSDGTAQNDGNAQGPSSESGDSVPYGGGPGYGSPRATSANRIFVANLSWSTDDMALQQLFNEHGTVLEARIVKDRDTGRSRGFGFVSMSTPEEMKAAIAALSGKQVDGRALTVNEASNR